MKRFFKRNSHNLVLKGLAGFGRAMNRLYENRNHDVYSNGEVTVIKKLSKINPVVIIDGGANIGSYTQLLQQHNSNAAIYSFEPVKATFEKLNSNVGSNSKVTTINKGLFSENCSKTINLFSSDTHSSIYDIQGISYSPENQTTIDLIKGDDFVAEHDIQEIDFLKIDVEGAEYDALLGFENTLKAGKIKAIQFEYGYINITTKKLLIDFYNLLEGYGYKMGKIYPKKVEFRKYQFKHEDFLGPNFIAVHESQKELLSILS